MKRLNDHLNCREYDKKVSRATASENGLTFELVNNSGYEIAKWRIDGCVLKAVDGSKCDYLLIVKETSTCYWIELKDEDFDDCCLQIHSTIKAIHEAKDYNRHCAKIVLGRFKDDTNKIDNLKYTNHKKLVNHIGRQNLAYKTKKLTETI